MDGDVKRFYEDGVVFVTGGTGFLGKLLLQKLLCHTLVRKIFILVRCKKDKNEAQRYAEIFEHKIFETTKEEKTDYLSRVELVTGDCVLPNLGISHNDWEKLKNSVNIVFHCAATVRFDQKLKTAACINVRAPMDLLRNAKEFKKLKAFVHVSTAYANCPRKDINELFYEPGMSPKNLLDLINSSSDDVLQEFTPKLIENWPNTYVYTKCVCEDVIRTDGVGLPVALVRPSMVISTYKEPIAGWIDNFYGPIGITYAVGMGILRTLNGNVNNLADMVPADYVVNALVVAAWKVSQKTNTERENVSIYNFVSTPENPITWKYYMDTCFSYTLKVAMPTAIYKPILFITEKRWLDRTNRIILHWIPAFLIDFVCLCIGKKQLMVDGYKKIHKFVGVVEYFTCREWDFDNQKTQKLWECLGEEDKKLFPFCMKNFNWDEFIVSYVLGGRTYLLKEPVDTIPTGRKKMKRLYLLHNILKCIFYMCILCFLLSFVYKYFK